MLPGIIFLLVVVILAIISARERQRMRRLINRSLPEDTVETPFSQALYELVGIAGGIYLALVMLVTFLGLEVPEKVSVSTVRVDPIAIVAVGATILQPLVLRIWYSIKFTGK